MHVAAALALALATPALAQGPEVAPPPPPAVGIPGVDTPLPDPAASLPPPPPPEAPSGPEYLPSFPVRLAPRIHRGGGYFGMGVGFGTADFAPRSFAGTGQALFALRAGRIFADQILLGPEAVFSAQYDRWAENTLVGTGLSSLMMQLMAFPIMDLPLNVAGGVGWGSGLSLSRLKKASDGAPVVAEGRDGVSWMTALGWDFFAGRGWNFGLQARYDGVHFIGNGTGNTRGFALQLWLNSY